MVCTYIWSITVRKLLLYMYIYFPMFHIKPYIVLNSKHTYLIRCDQMKVFPHVRTTSLPGWLHNYQKKIQYKCDTNDSNNYSTATG